MCACFPQRRHRRNRCQPAVRELVQEVRIQVQDLIQPLFVQEDTDVPEPIASMPGMYRYPISALVEECGRLQDLGISAVALFPKISTAHKDAEGRHVRDEQNVLYRSLRALKAAHPKLWLIADVALDPYTDHGHDGLMTENGTDVDNDKTLAVLTQLAVREADAGADWVAPSDMMDGRVAAIRAALDDAGHTSTGILAYSAKFASAYYGPFREAVGSQTATHAPALDKSTYQLNPANRREAIHDALLDEQEGADALMVKPAGPYLDVLWALRQRTDLPLAAYQVSGEYAQIHAASRLNWLDYAAVRDESLLAIKRAGANMILTYFATEWAAAHA